MIGTDNIAWHYTSAIKLPFILSDWQLKPMTADDVGAAPLLWLTAQPHEELEQALLQNFYRLPLDDWRGKLFSHTPVRFGLPCSDMRIKAWPSAWNEAGISLLRRDELNAIARGYGANPEKWFVSQDAIPLGSLVAEVRLFGKWWTLGGASALAIAVAEMARIAAFRALSKGGKLPHKSSCT